MGIHVFSGSSDPDGFFQTQADPTADQWGGKAPDRVQTGYIPGDPNSTYFKEGAPVMSDVAGTSGAELATARYRGMADAAGNRAVPTSDFSAGDALARQGLAARSGQSDALSMIRQRAAGGGPSASTMQMSQGNDMATQGQLAAMAGSRPDSAVAQQNAAGQASLQQSHNIAQAGNARAGEISGAQGSMFGNYNEMRGADLAAMRMQDARAQHMGNLALQQRSMNQGNRLAYEGMGQNVEQAQMDANAAKEAAAQRRRTQQGNLDMASRTNSDNNISGVISAGASGAGAAASDERVKRGIEHIGFQRGR